MRPFDLVRTRSVSKRTPYLSSSLSDVEGNGVSAMQPTNIQPLLSKYHDGVGKTSFPEFTGWKKKREKGLWSLFPSRKSLAYYGQILKQGTLAS